MKKKILILALVFCSAFAASAADNQIGGPQAMVKFHFGLNLELPQLSDPEVVEATLKELIANAPQFTHNCLKVYDGLGLERVAQAVLTLLETAPH